MVNAMANLNKQKLRSNLLKYCSKYNVEPPNTHDLYQDSSREACENVVNEITNYLMDPIEKNIRLEISTIFEQCENPEIPYFEVVMDIMQFMNEFVGNPHVVELIFARVNNDVAKNKIEVEDQVLHSDEEWTPEFVDAAMQKFRDSGTERDYNLMIDKLLDILSYFTSEEDLQAARVNLTGIIKRHSECELAGLCKG